MVSGAVNADGRLLLQATRVGAGTQSARMPTLVRRAQQGNAAAQRVADRIASVFAPAGPGPCGSGPARLPRRSAKPAQQTGDDCRGHQPGQRREPVIDDQGQLRLGRSEQSVKP